MNSPLSGSIDKKVRFEDMFRVWVRAVFREPHFLVIDLG